MAMDQSALLDLLAQLKLTDVTDRIRSATETLYQELIDAEATAFIGAAPFDRNDAAQEQAGNRVDQLIWLDDDISKHRAASNWAKGSPVPTLLITPRAGVGITR